MTHSKHRHSHRRRIGIYGGTFDPIHFGHLLLAESARQQMHLDEVRFVPAGIPPHKRDWILAPDEDRVVMLELAIAGNPYFKLERYEIDKPTISYTVHTVEYLQEQNPDADLFLLLGEDMLRLTQDREAAASWEALLVMMIPTRMTAIPTTLFREGKRFSEAG